jgi:hypothetical protein
MIVPVPANGAEHVLRRADGILSGVASLDPQEIGAQTRPRRSEKYESGAALGRACPSLHIVGRAHSRGWLKEIISDAAFQCWNGSREKLALEPGRAKMVPAAWRCFAIVPVPCQNGVQSTSCRAGILSGAARAGSIRSKLARRPGRVVQKI